MTVTQKCQFCDFSASSELDIQFLDGRKEKMTIKVCKLCRDKLAMTPNRINDEALI